MTASSILFATVVCSLAAVAVVFWRRRRRAGLEALDALFVRGVRQANRLMPAQPEFSWAVEDRILADWDARVLPLLEAHGNFKELSNFRTLYEWDGRSTAAEGKDPLQNKMEAIWRRKLDLLRSVIDRLGA